ncbi:MAG: type VI secretion system protein, partial [Thermodesulfobacteriota bacterium]|nr:type VI secretion system protein [Thermodesulfobacteriota bacterium]
VTKCDLIQGMTQFCNSLPEKNLDQAMGGINHDLSSEVTLFQDRVIQTIGKRLRDFRLLLLHKSESKVVDPGLLLFPEEFERLNPGLAAFIKGAFQENPYQETPMLRGLFVSSGRQEGSPYSHFLNALGLIEDKEVLPGTNKGLFLHDFFARIMPKDRGLFAPTLRALEWNRLTRNLGLTAWVALVIALCGLLSFSFVKNLRTMREVSHEFTKPPVLQGDTITDVMIMDRFYRAILKVEERNRRWLIPRFGLRESRNVEVQLKNKYCTVFKGGFLVSRDEKMAEKMADFSASTPQEVIGQHVVHLVRRINLLKTRLEGEELEVLHAKPHPSYDPLVLQTGEKLIPEIRQKIGTLYLSYLVWRSDPASLNIEMNDLQMWLKHILALKGTNLNWLITWVNENPSLSSLSFEDFWGGSLSASHEATVMPAFTRKGKEELDSFLNETESALPDPLLIASKKLEFQEWYHHAYIGAWYDFGTSFSEGMNRLKGREEWQRMAVTMATKQEPYFTLIDRMVEELEPFIKNKTLPPWIKLVYAFHDIKLQADREAALKEKSTLAKATDTGRKLFTQMGKEEAFEAQLVAAKALQEYRKVLAEILPATASQIVAYQMASQAYNEDPTTSKSPFFIAQSAVSNLKSNMSHIGADQQMFWEIVSGPLLYLWTFVRIETGCRLQDIWEKQVLLEVEGIGNQKNLTQLLLGQDGYAMKFIEGHAAPFMSRSLRKKGYYAKQVLGGKIPFEDSFLSFLTKGTRAVQPIKARYAVTIRGLPIDTNSDAQIRPHATRLEVRCSGETQTLVNLNYPVVKTFDWSPQTCDDVTFQIEVGNLVLTRKYKGYQAFPRFLKDFSGGQRTFYPGAFPSKKAALKRLGIKYIKAKYRFKGHEPVLKLLFAVPGKVPSNIVRCWDR